MGLLDKIDQVEQQQIGGGYICKARIVMGYKVYASGFGNKETFFEFDPGNEETQPLAKALALEFIQTNHIVKNKDGEEKPVNPAVCIGFVVDGADVINRTVEWTQPRYLIYPTYADGWKIVRESLAKNNVDSLISGWMNIKFVKDPSGRKQTMPDGTERDNFIAYLEKVYASESEARQEVNDLGVVVHPGSESASAAIRADAPAGWTKQAWESVVQTILDDYYKKDKTPKQLADEYGVTVPDIMSAIHKGLK